MTTKSRLLLIELQIVPPTVVFLFVWNSDELNGAYKQIAIIKFARAPSESVVNFVWVHVKVISVVCRN